jgi:hypothetical protein
MFTVKLMRGINNSNIKIIEAREVEIRMGACGGTVAGVQHAVIVKPGPDGTDDFWHYVGGPDWDMAVIENAAGKTTEIVRAPERTIEQAVARAA